MIKKFGCKNIKAIREYSEIEIRPITILMGENSSGKSSLLQGLSLLSVNKIFGNDIRRIKYNNPFSNFGDNNSFKNRGEEIVLYFQIVEDSDSFDIELHYEDDKSSDEHGILKSVYINSEKFELEIDTTIDSYLSKVLNKLNENLEAIRHIGILKDIKATYDYPNDYIGYFGEQYRSIAKSLSSKAYINRAIKNIFEYEIKKIDKDTGDFYLSDSKLKKSLTLNMFGSSLNSTIPILTQYAKNNEKKIRDKYRLTIIEEPEVNEHPLSQAKLIESLFPKNRPKKHFNIIETHSDHIINKFRYLVAKKIIKYNDIVIYYKYKNSTDSIDRNIFYKIEIDRCGQFISDDFGKGGFPKGFFDATLDELFSLSGGC